MTKLVYDKLQKDIVINGETNRYYDVSSLISIEKYNKLPFSIRILLESAVRNCDNFQVEESDVNSIIDWETNQGNGVEVRFRPARVILQG
jgi:aconitate hydratase